MPSGDDVVHVNLATHAYREAVSTLCQHLALLPAPHRGQVAAQVRDVLASPPASDLLAASGTDPQVLTDRVVGAMMDYTPRASATARSPVHEAQILLLQQIDLAWWHSATEFTTEEDLATSVELVDLRVLRSMGQLDFRFAVASDGFVPRAYKYAIRKVVPRFAPGTPGLSSPYARPQMVKLLNDVASRFRTACNGESPALWINCITRTVVDQCRLQELGFSAHYPSAHCRGWAADIEVGWYERFGCSTALVGVLEEMRDRQLINAINEGRIWHVSPSPSYAGEA